jgi:hypothetical protein
MGGHQVRQIALDIFHRGRSGYTRGHIRRQRARPGVFYLDDRQVEFLSPLPGVTTAFDPVFKPGLKGLSKAKKPGLRKVSRFDYGNIQETLLDA